VPTIYIPKKSKNNYVRNANNLEIQQIYNSTTWKKLRLFYLKQHPLCEKCLPDKLTPAVEVHHIREISKGKDIYEKQELALDINNLMSLCVPCHHKQHNNN
jgi:5-methylcytosine-specific restriction enzyme A